MRIDKYPADMGFGTRKEVRGLIKKGLVTIGGTAITDPGTHVKDSDEVMLSGEPVLYREFVYIMMNKPPGVVSATEDPVERTVLDILRESAARADGQDRQEKRGIENHDTEYKAADSSDFYRKDIFPVGRLDKDTVGLLLLTNDGDLAHRLLSPAHHVPKRYFARVQGRLEPSHIASFAEGLDIGDEKPTLPAELFIKSSGDTSEAEVVISEGRYHQIKRMFAAIGAKVSYLKRLSMGSLTLDTDLPEGGFRLLTEAEINQLKTGKH